MVFGFGYVPDYRNKSFLKDAYMSIFGYPYPPRRNEARKVFSLLKLRKSDKILDIGCGDGVWYLELLRRGYSITGIDVSGHDLSKLKERAKKFRVNPEVMKQDAQKMRFKPESFDKVFSICTIEHIPDDNKVFNGIYKLLKNGGKCVVSIPLYRTSLYSRLIVKLPRPLKRLFFVDGVVNSGNEDDLIAFHSKKYSHYHNYNEREIIRRLEKIGFKINKIDYNCRFFGSVIYSMYHSLRIFERKKGMDTGYRFKNEALFALIAPFFYALFLLDDLFFWKKGQILIISMVKE